jgi:acyl-CoA thioesterase FadM
VRPDSIGDKSWTYEYEIELKDEKLRGGNKLVARGKTVQVAYDYESKKSVPIRNDIRTILMQQIENTRD